MGKVEFVANVIHCIHRQSFNFSFLINNIMDIFILIYLNGHCSSNWQVFTGNSNTCMKISGNQVQKIMTLVAKNKEKVPQFLDLLNAVVKVEELDLPLKRNQSFVMQYFMQFRSDIAHVIDQEEAAR